MSEKEQVFACMLLEWWGKNKRNFPWRCTRNPYEVLVAEMLLRKTTAKQVEKVYNTFISRYPDAKSLAEAQEDELRSFLKPLGFEHVRAKILKKFGLMVESIYGGHIPAEQKELLRLPGVGMYAANAVLSLVYSKDVPMMDTNFIRVIQRVFGINSSKKRARCDNLLWNSAKRLIPPGTGREFNLAVLDFAALVCTAKNPKCGECFAKNICDYFKQKMY